MVLVVIPTYNERENLPELVRTLVAQPATRVMIVDDGSPDGTGALADQIAQEFPGRVEVVHRTGRRGLGRSYVEGLQLALKATPSSSVRWTRIGPTIRSTCPRWSRLATTRTW